MHGASTCKWTCLPLPDFLHLCHIDAHITITVSCHAETEESFQLPDNMRLNRPRRGEMGKKKKKRERERERERKRRGEGEKYK